MKKTEGEQQSAQLQEGMTNEKGSIRAVTHEPNNERDILSNVYNKRTIPNLLIITYLFTKGSIN